MDITHLLERISISIAEIEKCTHEFQTQNTISRISVDSALAKTIQVYDSLLHLQRIVSVDSEIVECKQNEIIPTEILVEDSNTIPADEIQEQESTIEIEEIQKIATPPLEMEISHAETATPKTSSEVHKSSDIDVSQKLGKKPVSNIATAIGINERFQFIKELFQNNVELYTGAIQELNELSSFESALTLLQNKYTLDFEDELVQRFVSIVERRYL